jgi:hypothetical protein
MGQSPAVAAVITLQVTARLSVGPVNRAAVNGTTHVLGIVALKNHLALTMEERGRASFKSFLQEMRISCLTV